MDYYVAAGSEGRNPFNQVQMKKLKQIGAVVSQ